MTEHILITLERAINDYQLGFMTATGLVYFYFKTGGDKNLSAAEIAKVLGMNKNTCRKAVAKLRNLSEN